MVSAEDSFAVTEACLKARLSADKNEIVYFLYSFQLCSQKLSNLWYNIAKLQ
jgi:hypothetical protein